MSTIKTPRELFLKGIRYEDERTFFASYNPNRGQQAFEIVRVNLLRAAYRCKEMRALREKSTTNRAYWDAVLFGERCALKALAQVRRDMKTAKIWEQANG